MNERVGFYRKLYFRNFSHCLMTDGLKIPVKDYGSNGKVAIKILQNLFPVIRKV